jgi:hypothetical protein
MSNINTISNSMKTKELLIEACPDCHTVHCYSVAGEKIVIDGKSHDKIVCETIIGHREPTPEEVETVKATIKEKLGAAPTRQLLETELAKLTEIKCGHIVIPTKENSFTIRVLTFREKQKFYEIMGMYAPQNVVPGQIAQVKININPQVMDYMIQNGTVASPVPLHTKEDLDKCTLDGSILETLYGEITDLNGPPLAPFSTSLQRSTRTMRTSARATN